MIRYVVIYLLCTYPLFSSVVNQNEVRLTKGDKACIQEVFSLLHHRLQIARDIAKWKWNYRLPIDERDKEKKLMKEILQQALEEGIDMKLCTSVIMSQIIAAKAVQIQSFEDWIKNNTDLVPHPASDLLTLEKNMLEVDRKIIHHLIHLYLLFDRQDFFSDIALNTMKVFPEGQISEELRQEIIKPFLIDYTASM